MSMPLETLEAEAMQLSPVERGLLLRKLAISLDSEPNDSPEAIAQAWDEEIDRRLDKMDRGETLWVSGEDALRRIKVAATGKN